MKEFGYSSAAAIGLLVVTAGLSLAAVIANLPLQDKDEAKGAWKPGSDTLLAQAGTADPALSQPIEESFLVSFDPGADLQEADFVAMAQQQSTISGSYTIQSEEVEALAALSPAAGSAQNGMAENDMAPSPDAEMHLAPMDRAPSVMPEEPARRKAAAALVPDSIELRRPRSASAELLERSGVAPLQIVSLSLIPSDPPLAAEAEEEVDAVPPPIAEGSQIAAVPSDPTPANAVPQAVPELAPQQAHGAAPAVTSKEVPGVLPAPTDPPAGYVVIGSFLRLDAAAAQVLKYQDWQPTIVAGQVGDKLYQRVVVGPFSESDLRGAWERIVSAGIKDAWRLKLNGETDLAVKDLDVLG